MHPAAETTQPDTAAVGGGAAAVDPTLTYVHHLHASLRRCSAPAAGEKGKRLLGRKCVKPTAAICKAVRELNPRTEHRFAACNCVAKKVLRCASK